MGETTGISWTQSTFNPWIGCSKVSPGCTNCYAEIGPAAKFKGVKWGAGQPRMRTSESNWNLPLRYNRKAAASGERHLVFCASLADWLDDEVPIEWLTDLLIVVCRTPHLTWQLLTKRPQNWRQRIEAAYQFNNANQPQMDLYLWLESWLTGLPPSNVWVGTTVEDQRRADERIPWLLSIPAKVRFLSMEPLLEDVTLVDVCGSPLLVGIDWIIIGGESGTKARPFNLGWARGIVKQCKAAGVAVFVKQLGSNVACHVCGAPAHCVAGDSVPQGGFEARAACKDHCRHLYDDSHHMLRAANADPRDWPKELRVQEFPQ